jgi:hypothetical protein
MHNVSCNGYKSVKATALNFRDLCLLVPDSLVDGDDLVTG